MKNPFSSLVSAVLLSVISGCSSPNAAAPIVPEDHWSLDADRERNPAVVLRKGQSQAMVEEELGRPKRRSHPEKSNPEREYLYYERKVPGPLVQKTHSDGAGTITVRQQLLYVDKVTLIFNKGILESVKKDRSMEEAVFLNFIDRIPLPRRSLQPMIALTVGRGRLEC